MERASRSELLSTVTQQRDQLMLYKTKLRDVVAAYKSITKEKEALEASIAVLSTCASGHCDRALKQHPCEKSGSLQHENSDLSQDYKEEQDELSSLRNQVKTLSSSLTTLTQEKNKLEVGFIADKRQMKQDIEDLHLQLSEEKLTTSAEIERYEILISDLKSRLRTQQLEREKDQTNHSLMLKELQELVSMERIKKEQVMIQLEETRTLWKDNEDFVVSTPLTSENYEHQINELQNELTSVRDQIKAAEIKSNQPSHFVIELQQEMDKMKEIHQRQMDQEKIKASESEFRIQSQARQSEYRVSSLEANLSELSQTVGNYERLRCQDQQHISKLRERVTQLDLENTALVNAANQVHVKSKEEDLNVDKIVDKIMHLRDVLIYASQKSDKQVKLSSIFVIDLKSSDEELSTVKHYKNELEKMKEEFERLKCGSHSSLKTNIMDCSSTVDVSVLKEQVLDLRNKLRLSSTQHKERIFQFQAKEDSLSTALSLKEDQMKMKILQLKSSHQKEISQLELELKKQRERTLAMLNEKEQEFKRKFGWKYTDSNIDKNASGLDEQMSEENKAVNELLNLPKEIDNEAAFLHLSQEKSRIDVEITTLRKQKRELETSIRENNALSWQKESELQEEISALKDQNAEIERQCHREGASVEYLKNVLLKFLTSSNVDGKKQMLKALMTILQFSAHERLKVQQVSAKGWWSP